MLLYLNRFFSSLFSLSLKQHNYIFINTLVDRWKRIFSSSFSTTAILCSLATMKRLGGFLFIHSAQRRRFNLHFLHFLSFISSSSRVFLHLIYIAMKLKTNRVFECDCDDFECVIELRKYRGMEIYDDLEMN